MSSRNHQADLASNAPVWLLKAAFSLTCLSYAWSINRYSCKVFSFLWEEHGFSTSTAGRIEFAMIWLLLIAAAAIWLHRCRWISLAGAAVLLAEMLAETFMPSAKYPYLYWAEWALRYSPPFLLLLMADRYDWSKSCIRFLEFAIASVFAAHGVKALLSDPQFIDFVLATARRLGLEMSESTAVGTLHVVGIADLCAAALLLLAGTAIKRKLLLWMALWGLITAFSRVTYGGFGNTYEIFARCSHFLLPLALSLHFRRLSKGESANRRPDPLLGSEIGGKQDPEGA